MSDFFLNLKLYFANRRKDKVVSKQHALPPPTPSRASWAQNFSDQLVRFRFKAIGEQQELFWRSCIGFKSSIAQNFCGVQGCAVPWPHIFSGDTRPTSRWIPASALFSLRILYQSGRNLGCGLKKSTLVCPQQQTCIFSSPSSPTRCSPRGFGRRSVGCSPYVVMTWLSRTPLATTFMRRVVPTTWDVFI